MMARQIVQAFALARSEGGAFWIGALSLPAASVTLAALAFVASAYLKGVPA